MELIDYFSLQNQEQVAIPNPVPNDVSAVFVGEMNEELINLHTTVWNMYHKVERLSIDFEKCTDRDERSLIKVQFAKAEKLLIALEAYFSFRLNEILDLWSIDNTVYLATGGLVYYHEEKHCGCIKCQLNRIDDRIR